MASQKIGSYAFLLGIIIAIVFGLIAVFASDTLGPGGAGIVTIILVVLGLIVGFLNIHDKHVTDFLIAAIAIAMIGGTAGGLVSLDLVIAPLGSVLVQIVQGIVALVVAAALVIGLKQIMTLAKEQVM
jgi:hypothetical protein